MANKQSRLSAISIIYIFFVMILTMSPFLILGMMLDGKDPSNVIANLTTIFSILIPTVLLGVFFKFYYISVLTSSNLILFFAILGYILDWISLTNDITRFSDETTYIEPGQDDKTKDPTKGSYISGFSGRTNSIITGTLAMVADVYALYMSSEGYYRSPAAPPAPPAQGAAAAAQGAAAAQAPAAQAPAAQAPAAQVPAAQAPGPQLLLGKRTFRKRLKFGNGEGKSVINIKNFNTYLIAMALMTLIHFVWCVYLVATYELENPLLWSAVIIQFLFFVFFLCAWFGMFELFSRLHRIIFHVVFAISGFISVLLLNMTESKAKKNKIPRFLYGSNIIRATMNSLVIFANIFLGYQNITNTWKEGKDKLWRRFSVPLMIFSLAADYAIPSFLNYVNTSYQLKLKSKHLGDVPEGYDKTWEHADMIQIVIILFLMILITVLLSQVTSSEDGKHV